MKKIFLAVLFMMSIFLISCTQAQPKLSQMQIREMTIKEIEGSYKDVFKAAMSVLQDQEYIIENTDFNSGLIVGEKEVTEETTTGDVLMRWFVDRNHDRNAKVKASLSISEVTENVTKVRINLQEKKLISRSFSSPKEITINIQEKEIYITLFNQIRTEVERIKATK